MNATPFHPLRLDELDQGLSREILVACGVDVTRCLECGACSGGCPNGRLFDFTPRKIVQLIRLGKEAPLISLDALWVCLACQICRDRCPAGIDLPRVLDHIRERSQQEGLPATRPRVEAFLKAMLHAIAARGRIAELPLMGRFARVCGGVAREDIILGLRMFRRGKLRPFPPRVRRIGEIREIFAASRVRGPRP